MARDLPPLRLTEDPNTSSALRQLVDGARRDIPSTNTLDRFATRLGAAIAANAPGPNLDVPAAPSAIGAKLLGGKWLAVALGVAAGSALLGGWYFVSASKQPPESVARVVAESNSNSRAAPSPAVVGVSNESGATAPSPAEVPATAVSAANLPHPSPPKAGSPRSEVTEARLLLSARTALATDPQRALRLTKEHARRFPHGDLVQEREVIAIEALRRLGNTEAARKRGADFNHDYPDSVHQPKIDQTLKAKTP